MDLLKQHLTFGCMSAFEDVGVQELETELLRRHPQLHCHCEYSQTEDVLVVKGNVGGYISSITAMISSFIEEQKSNDLLDTPRMRTLDLSSVVHSRPSVVTKNDDGRTEALLSLDDDTATFIPHPRTQVTKFWLTSGGGVGCFSRNAYKDVLKEISNCTGTEINLVDNFKGIQISGGSLADVDDALTRLSQVERPLTYLKNPEICNIAVGKTDNGDRYKIQPYGSLNSLGVRRVLADPSFTANAGLGQMFVTSLYTYDEDTQKFSPFKTLTKPQQCNRENGASRFWSDFVHQEVGKGDTFSSIKDSAVESNLEARNVPLEVATTHPYLSPAKAKQVNEWVTEKSSTETADAARKLEGLANTSSRPQTPSRLPAGLDDKQVPGIKKRRPVAQIAQAYAEGPIRSAAPEATTPVKSQAEPKSTAATPRKRWNMTYEQTVSSLPKGHDSSTRAENAVAEGHSVLGKPVTSSPQKAKGTTPAPITFDPTSYGLSKMSPQKIRLGTGGSKAQKARRSPPFMNVKPSSKQPANPSGNKHELVDVLTPVETILSSQPPLAHNAPALIPKPQAVPANIDFSDLVGLDLGGNEKSEKSTVTSSSYHDGSNSKGSSSFQAARLANLQSSYDDFQTASPKSSFNPAKRPECVNRSKQLAEQVLRDRGRSCQAEAEQSDDEATSRRYHRTMSQRMAKPDQKAKIKAAKKQATLDDAWGPSKPKKQVKDSSTQDGPPHPPSAEAAQNAKTQNSKAGADEDTGHFLAALRPVLEAAEFFPGVLTLEIQFGLVLVPYLPKSLDLGLMSSNDWSRLFRPRTGATPPSTKFVNRLTTCGSEVDHIVDLKTSKAEGKSRMFEEAYSEYNVSYEFHCRTRKDELFIVVIDEQGQYTIQHPKSALGAVNMHFPSRFWDSRALVESARQYRPGSRPEMEENAKSISENLWIPAEKTIRLHTSLPAESKVTIDKVFLKRWTRHRHLPPDNVKAREDEATGNQNVFLQVTEVQDLFIGILNQASSAKQPIRARYTDQEEMIRMGKVWYELSLFSSDIEAILKTNAALEVGDRTTDWCAADLCGGRAADVNKQASGSPCTPAPAIGAGSLAEMFKVAKSVVGKMDGVGACNRGPLGLEMALAVSKPIQSKGLDHDDIESVKEVESVVARINRPFDAEAFKREQQELEFW